jgi:hypothetical protein
MKIVKVAGGLGNQMFQYAFARALEARSGEDVYLDTSTYEYMPAHNGFELGKVFAVQYHEAREVDVERLGTRPRSVTEKIRRKYFTKRSHYIDRYFRYDPKIFELQGDRYFEGYWQSEKYFAPVTDGLRKEFVFISDPGSQNRQILEETKKARSSETSGRHNLVSVHVRRGDSLRLASTRVCTGAYYANAFALVRERLESPMFLVFSDDVPWCRHNLGLDDEEVFYVEWNKGTDSWRDMWLMSRCSGHIIANSSFSWWGAWLDPKPDKLVIAPEQWSLDKPSRLGYYRYDFRDIVPEAWLKAQI